MARITFINNNDIVEIHGEGCSDISKKLRKFNVEFAGTGEFATVREAFLDYNEDFIAEGGEENGWPIKNFPCTGIK